MFGELRREVGEAIGKVCKMEGVTIIKVKNVTRSCTYVCFDSAKGKRRKNNRENQGKKCPYDFLTGIQNIGRDMTGISGQEVTTLTVGNVNEDTIKPKYITERV